MLVLYLWNSHFLNQHGRRRNWLQTELRCLRQEVGVNRNGYGLKLIIRSPQHTRKNLQRDIRLGHGPPLAQQMRTCVQKFEGAHVWPMAPLHLKLTEGGGPFDATGVS